MNINRYHTQMMLPDFGIKGQKKLLEANVLVVGAGGLGCPVAQYLAATGIGRLTLMDHDVVEEKNLHRQVLYTPKDIGKKKVLMASERLRLQNPEIEINAIDEKVITDNVLEQINPYDIIVDATDNLEVRLLLNDACVIKQKPLIYGAIYQNEGQVTVWNMPLSNGHFSPNYRDIFPRAELASAKNCAEGGVMPALVSIIGSMQAQQVINYYINPSQVLTSKLWIFDLASGMAKIIKLPESSAIKVTELEGPIPEININEIDNKTHLLIDVRTREEHLKKNIGGKNIPLNELNEDIENIPIDKPIICYCKSGKRSITAARRIKKRFRDSIVYTLKGGMDAIIKDD